MKETQHNLKSSNELNNIVNEFDKMPKDEQIQFAQMIVQKSFSGPLPPSEDFARYEQVTSGAGDRILKMAEEQAKHRQTLEMKMVQSQIHSTLIGQIMAFTICLIVLGAGIYFVLNGMNNKGFVAIFTPLALLVGAFLYGKNKNDGQ